MKSIDQTEYLPTTHGVFEAFNAEVAALGGGITDVYEDGTRLFVRAVLPPLAEVRPGDRVQGGVALRTTATEILVHPYVFREVCTNGAIRAHALESRRIQRFVSEVFVSSAHSYELAATLAGIGVAVRACASSSAFADAVQEMEVSVETETDMMFTLLSMFPQGQNYQNDPGLLRVLEWVLGQMEAESDHSSFTLGNALTAAGRDERDPEVRWQLEELGARVFAYAKPMRTASDIVILRSAPLDVRLATAELRVVSMLATA